MRQPKKVMIIGAGIAGLASAARLAAQGFRVTIAERNPHAGGKLDLLSLDGYSWDTGPSLFTQPGQLQQLFQDCGKAIEDYFRYKPLTEGTRYFWEDGTALHAEPEKSKLAENIRASLGIAPEPMLRYLDDAEVLYNRIGTIFLDEPIHRLRTWTTVRIPRAFTVLKWSYLFSTLHRYNEQRLKHPKLVQMLDRMATYNGSDPYQCPAMLSMIAHLEFNEGAWFPDGGMISIPIALRKLCEDLGVSFMTGVDVRGIKFEKRITGIEGNDQFFESDAVISNSDVYFTYRDLLQDAQKAKQIQRLERSSSGLIFYWGIRKTFPQLGLHNVFFSEDYRAEFSSIFKARRTYGDPTIYVNITSKMEAAHAPEGCENWFVLINMPSRSEPMGVKEIAQLRKAAIDKLSRMLGTSIGALIQTEQVLTPEGIERKTGSYAGALYGTSSNGRMAAFLRHPNHAPNYPGLFFAGGTVHPGGGIPLCLRSGKLAAEAVREYLE
jgi:phytoene desaturase